MGSDRYRYPRMLIAALVLCSACLAADVTGRARAAEASYVVQPNDTLSAIAQRFGTSIAALMAANNLTNPNLIVAGQQIVIAAATANASYSNAAAASNGTYVVQPGDTLSAIGQRYGLAVQAIASANGITNPASLRVGQQLSLPAASGIVAASSTSAAAAPISASGISYIVQAGDTLSAIALRYGTTVDAMMSSNGITDPTRLSIGQQIAIPSDAAMPASGTIEALLNAEAAADGIDAGLLKGLAWQESGWQMVTASDGGMGVMQLMPDSVTWVSQSLLGYQINPYDPADNIRAGAAMLRYYLQVFGDAPRALAAYHQGLVSVQTVGILPDTQTYISNILALQARFGG